MLYRLSRREWRRDCRKGTVSWDGAEEEEEKENSDNKKKEKPMLRSAGDAPTLEEDVRSWKAEVDAAYCSRPRDGWPVSVLDPPALSADGRGSWPVRRPPRGCRCRFSCVAAREAFTTAEAASADEGEVLAAAYGRLWLSSRWRSAFAALVFARWRSLRF